MRNLILFSLSTLVLLMYPLSFPLDVNSATTDQAVSPDFDGNGIVDFADFLAFVGQFGARQGDGRYEAKYDLDSDGAIGFSDFLIFSSNFGKEVSSPNVDIPDANLRAVIADSLGKASDAPITQAEMASLTRLEVPNKNISDLTGLESATNLIVLDLGHPLGQGIANSNEISSLSPLSGLTSLEELYLSGADISDATPLANLNSLLLLDLAFNNISNVTPLANLNSLETLYLSSNRILTSASISDVAPLSNLIGLKTLTLSGNNISDVAPLSNLTNLEELNLDDNSISDITPLSNLTNLEALVLSNNNISDITPLSGLTNLEWLFLNGNNISDITPLSGLTSLEWLELSFNSIVDLSPLVANTGLGSGDRVGMINNPLSATSINTHIPALQNRGVDVSFGASKPAVKEQERDILRIERWETGDYMYRRQMAGRRDVIR